MTCSRRDFIKLAGLSFMAASCRNAPIAAEPEAPPPNIIYILTDDLGYGDLGCYGQERIKTPNIDRMAAEGMRFTDHYAGCTVCAPSRCVLMTGLHTGHAYIRGNKETKPMGQEPLPADTVTVAKLMKEAGYRTGLIGKWGLGGPGSIGTPNKQGFDYFFGYLCQRHAHNFYPEFLFRNEERVPLAGNEIPADKRRGDGAGVAVKKVTYSHDVLAEEALQFVRRNRQDPFFLCLTVTIPHANNEAGGKGMEVPSYGIYEEEEWPDPQKGHAAMISRLDRDVGRLLETLKELKIDGNTVVMFSSDNGPHREGGANPTFFKSSGPLRGYKRALYEGGIRVPMIARWPGKIKAGTQTPHLSAFWDCLPTFAELAGAGAPAGIDGISFAPILLGRDSQQKKHDHLYWEFRTYHTQAVRKGPWKAVRFLRQNRTELYNLAKDIGEKQDVSRQHPGIVADLEKCMARAHEPSALFPLDIDKQ